MTLAKDTGTTWTLARHETLPHTCQVPLRRRRPFRVPGTRQWTHLGPALLPRRCVLAVSAPTGSDLEQRAAWGLASACSGLWAGSPERGADSHSCYAAPLLWGPTGPLGTKVPLPYPPRLGSGRVVAPSPVPVTV